MFLLAEHFFFFSPTRGSPVDSLARNRALGEGLTRNIGNSISLLASNQKLEEVAQLGGGRVRVTWLIYIYQEPINGRDITRFKSAS